MSDKIKPIFDHKAICRKLAPPDWQYGGFDSGFYYFQTGNYATGFREMACKEEDLTVENLALMAKLGVTRVIK